MGRVVAAATIIAVHGNFLKNIPSLKGEKSTPALRRRRDRGKGRRRRRARKGEKGRERIQQQESKGERCAEERKERDIGEKRRRARKGGRRERWVEGTAEYTGHIGSNSGIHLATPQILQSCWTSCSLHNRIRMNRPLPPSTPSLPPLPSPSFPSSSHGFILFTRRFYPALRTTPSNAHAIPSLHPR